MTTADDRWDIDIGPALAALKRLRDSIGKTDKKAAEGFDRSAAASKQARDEFGRFIATGTKGSKSLGGAIGGLTSPLGAVTAGVGALIASFAALGVAGAAAFAAITAKGVELNKGAEITRIALIQIFEGNEGAADAFIDTIGDLSVELGTSRQLLTGFAKGILPDVGTIGGTTELLKNVIILGKDAGAQIDDIRRTLEGALVGDFVGFQDVLNIPPPTIKKIKELAKEIGNAEAITAVLGDRIQEQGLSVEAFADTLDTLENKLAAQFEDFTKLLGVAPFEELKEQAADFLGVLEEQGPGIEIVAKAFGDLAANVIEFVGSNLSSFIEGIDFEGVEGLVDGITDAVDAGELLLGVIFDLGDASSFNNLINVLTTVAGKLKEAATTAAQIVALNKAVQAQQQAEAEVFGLEKTERALLGDKLALAIARRASTEEKVTEAAAAGEAAYEASLRKSLLVFDELNESEKENEQIRKDRRKVTEDTTEADKAAGEAVLARNQQEKELADAQAKAAKAQEEISEKTAGLEEDRQKRLTDIARKEAQKRFDDQVKNAQKREDIARKDADSIEDIFRKQNQRLSDAAKDLSQDEQDIARKGTQERQQIERDAANERIEVERSFRQELQDIQRKFSQSAQDAERTNDAQAFLQAVRARDEQIEVAKQERDVSLEDVGRGAQEQRADLKVQLAQEVEDSKIANARKLEDLQTRLNQELEQQAIKNERDLEQQAIQEQRQKEQRDLAAQRTLEDFERTQTEKEAKLNESLEKQFALIEAAAQKELELLVQTETEKTKIVAEEMERRARALRAAEEEAAQTSLPPLASGTGRRPNQPLTPMAEGGDIAAGQTALVGEKGMELFTAPTGGRIIPNQAMFSPPASPGLTPSNVNNSRNLNVEQLGINPGDGILSRMVQNEVSKMLELLG